MNWFWKAFWPNLFATAIGVAIGVPIALWINNYTTFIGEQARQAQNREQLNQGLTVVLRELDFNRERLQHFADVLRKDEVLYDLGLDLSVWEVTKGEIVPLLRDPALQQRLAYHFGQLNALSKVSGLSMDQAYWPGWRRKPVPQVNIAVRKYLVEETRRLLEEIPRLKQEILAREGRETAPQPSR